MPAFLRTEVPTVLFLVIPVLQPSTQHQAWHSTRSKHLLGKAECCQHNKPTGSFFLRVPAACADGGGDGKDTSFQALTRNLVEDLRLRAVWVSLGESNLRAAPLEQRPWKVRQRESCQPQGLAQSLWGARAGGKGQPQQQKTHLDFLKVRIASKFFPEDLFYFMSMDVWPACKYEHQVHACWMAGNCGYRWWCHHIGAGN